MASVHAGRSPLAKTVAFLKAALSSFRNATPDLPVLVE